MSKAVFLLSLVVLINASTYTSANVIDFSEGFLQGIEADPSSPTVCVKSIDSLIVGTRSILDDLVNLANGVKGSWTQLILDIQSSEDITGPVKENCNFSGLSQKLKDLMTPEGLQKVLSNYFTNIEEVSENLQNLEDCGDDYKSCGIYSGEIFTLLVGWELNTFESVVKDHAKVDTATEDYTLLLKGILTGLQSDPASDSQCVSEMNSVVSGASTLIADVEKYLAGNSAAMFKIYKDFEAIMKITPNLSEDCGVEGLMTQFKNLMGPNGIMILLKNYKANSPALSSDLKAVLSCSSDYTSCGEAMGEAFRLLVGWSL